MASRTTLRLNPDRRDELRERAPGLRADCGYSPAVRPPNYLNVAAPGEPARTVVWDERYGVYRWQSGPDAGGQVGATASQAAEAVALALGVSIP